MMMDLDQQTETVLRTENINIFYGAFHAVKNVLWRFLKIALLP